MVKYWTKEESLIALKLYCEIPFGKIDARNKRIVRVATQLDRTPNLLAMKLLNFASLDPEITQTGRVGLKNVSKADKALWEDVTSNWEGFLQDTEVATSQLGVSLISVELQEDSELLQPYEGFTQERIIQARKGQAFFRKCVLSAYDYSCCISALSIPSLLVASHIIPWGAEATQRLNPRNGLCLSMLHDKAFDLGLITISPQYTVMVSPVLENLSPNDAYLHDSLLSFKDKPLRLPNKFRPHQDFLDYHRTHIFKAA